MEGKLAGLGEPIAPAKLQGLREALERDHVVRFHNGSQVEYEDCTKCAGRGQVPVPSKFGWDPPDEVAKMEACPTCGGEKVRLLVTRPAGGVARYRLDRELHAAYAMAFRGPAPREQPTGDPAKYGDDPPW